MKNSLFNSIRFSGFAVFLFILLNSCAITLKTVQLPNNYKDPVCEMSLKDSDDTYSWKYKGSVFTFCSYNCKKAFMMSPEKFTMKKNCEN